MCDSTNALDDLETSGLSNPGAVGAVMYALDVGRVGVDANFS